MIFRILVLLVVLCAVAYARPSYGSVMPPQTGYGMQQSGYGMQQSGYGMQQSGYGMGGGMGGMGMGR
uniref:Uncharacterized protein n=1 Tax=Acrobeloides nanus TaxID=290746 RepID=A0A914ELD7_9BILA